MAVAPGCRLTRLGLRRAHGVLGALGLLLSACTPPHPSDAARSSAAARVAPAAARDLVGTTPNTVVAALGPPALRRVDGRAEVWLYGGEHGCRLDLVFYRDGPTLRVAMTTAHPPPKTTEAACLQRFAAAQ